MKLSCLGWVHNKRINITRFLIFWKSWKLHGELKHLDQCPLESQFLHSKNNSCFIIYFPEHQLLGYSFCCVLQYWYCLCISPGKQYYAMFQSPPPFISMTLWTANWALLFFCLSLFFFFSLFLFFQARNIQLTFLCIRTPFKDITSLWYRLLLSGLSAWSFFKDFLLNC